jgi:hypothetical protein
MTEAIFGLAGVALGGLITGGATYLAARRSERLEARASARLLQGELQLVAYKLDRQLQAMKRVAERESERGNPPRPRDARATRSRGRHWLAQFSMAQWQEHRSRLAHVLDTDDWYAVSSAYAAIGVGQDLAKLQEVPEEDDDVPRPIRLDRLVIEGLYRDVESGVLALSRLAGRQLTERDLSDASTRSLLTRSATRRPRRS